MESRDNGQSIKNFRDLRVWQGAMDLVEAVYRVTKAFPREETYGLANQMQRAAVSVPSNIAEGFARESLKEYLHHLSIAQGSLAELETQLEIAVRLRYAESGSSEPFKQQAEGLARQLNALRRSLERKLHQHPTPNTQHP